ncbi:hypothetical protein FACS1894159_03180 [Bacteroidia bacterium]|nr:hypothetical protein FACS1894159_03180 [Bacteroidia bacterium]
MPSGEGVLTIFCSPPRVGRLRAAGLYEAKKQAAFYFNLKFIRCQKSFEPAARGGGVARRRRWAAPWWSDPMPSGDGVLTIFCSPPRGGGCGLRGSTSRNGNAVRRQTE